MYLKIQLLFSVTGTLSFGTLTIGAIWENSIDTTQKIIVGSLGSFGTFASVLGYVVNYAIFNNRSN